MFLTGLMPENKVRTSDKKRKEKYIYLYIIFHNCGFLKGLLEPATPQKEMIIIVIKKIITMIIMMMMMIEVHLNNNLLLLCIYLCRGGYGD